MASDHPRPPIAFRPAGRPDVAAIVELVESAYRGDSSRAGWTTEADLLDGQRTDSGQVVGLLDRPGSIVVVAEAGGRLLACCHLDHLPPGAAYFGMFAVRPDQQGGGIGRAVVDESFRIARTWGCREMRMTVIRQRDDLIAWYRRLGFTPTGETQPFPYGDERFGRPRRDDLEFVVLSAPVGDRTGAPPG